MPASLDFQQPNSLTTSQETALKIRLFSPFANPPRKNPAKKKRIGQEAFHRPRTWRPEYAWPPAVRLFRRPKNASMEKREASFDSCTGQKTLYPMPPCPTCQELTGFCIRCRGRRDLESIQWRRAWRPPAPQPLRRFSLRSAGRFHASSPPEGIR